LSESNDKDNREALRAKREGDTMDPLSTNAYRTVDEHQIVRVRRVILLVDSEDWVFYMVGGRFLFIHVQDASAYRAYVTNAFQPLPTNASDIIGGSDVLPEATSTVDPGECALCVDDDDTVYLLLRDAETSPDPQFVLKSKTFGDDWDGMGEGSGRTSTAGNWYRIGDNATYPDDYCATVQRGRIVGPDSTVP